MPLNITGVKKKNIPILCKYASFCNVLERELFFFREGSLRERERHLASEGSANMFSGLGPVADIFFVMYYLECLWSYVLPQHSKKAPASDGLCDYFTSSSGKEYVSSPQILYGCDALATFGYFSLGSGKLDPDHIRKAYPRSILALASL